MLFENRLFVKPITVGFLMLIYAGILFFSEMPVYYAMLGGSALMLILISGRKFFEMAAGYVILLLTILALAQSFKISTALGALYTMLLIVLKLFPLLILAKIAANFNISEIISSLRKIYLPNNLCIGIATFIHFIPEYRRYLSEIEEGLKVRNISFSILKPIQSIEMYLVPMIYKAFETGNTLACALVTKGIEYDCEKTSYADLSLSWRDYIAIIFGVSLIGITIWLKLSK